MSGSLDMVVASMMGTVIPGFTCSKGEVVPPMGPMSGSNRERSVSSRRGYIKRVRYDADCGRALRGLSMPLLRFKCAAVVLPGLVTLFGLRFLLPDLDDGL